jgi:hypothetical protein
MRPEFDAAPATAKTPFPNTPSLCDQGVGSSRGIDAAMATGVRVVAPLSIVDDVMTGVPEEVFNYARVTLAADGTHATITDSDFDAGNHRLRDDAAPIAATELGGWLFFSPAIGLGLRF